jgi:hypothetical protein
VASTDIAIVLDKLIFGSRLHEHADPAQRVAGVQALPPESPLLAQLLAADPAAEVRAAAAARSTDGAALANALASEPEPAVRTAAAAALGALLAAAPDAALAQRLLTASGCNEATRVLVALNARDEAQRQSALSQISDEPSLVEIALGAEHAAVRAAAAGRVRTEASLRLLLKGARDKDRGVARLARERLDAFEREREGAARAEALLGEADALVAQPGPIVMAAVELDRRWKALGLPDDDVRRSRWDEIGRRMQQRFDRELAEQRSHAQFAQRLDAWLATLPTPPLAPPPAELPQLREQWQALQAEAVAGSESAALGRLTQAEQRLAQWEQAAPALAAAEALVLEAEQLATGTPIDDAQLPARWQALDRSARTPALSRRFEAALLVIEQRRLAVIRASQQEQTAARLELHSALHEAEQALAAGQLQPARSAADRARALKVQAGQLPKPSVQRLSRVVQQLVELERWEHFGQQTARVQLAERAEALLAQPLAPLKLAREVQQLRAEWKKLDEQHAGVPKALWERFDGACERAYAPAARHFAEQAALHKQSRQQREEFIAAAAAHAPTLLTEPRDWRALERWLRDTEAAWRDKALGSVDPGVWKKLEARLKAALAPLHAELNAARAAAKAQRMTLIAEAEALAPLAAERDTPARVKELQTRWQANAKAIVLPQRDERALWDRFRHACNAVFEARTSTRKAEDQRRTGQRRAFEAIVGELEQLAQAAGAADGDEASARAARHELEQRWKQAGTEHGPAPAPLEARFKAARAQLGQAKRGQGRTAEAAALQTLLAKERLCEEADLLAAADTDAAAQDAELQIAESVRERWSALTSLPAAWEQQLAARRDAALDALADADARYDHAGKIEHSAAARRDALLELELTLGLETPPDLQAQRLAVQVKQLRDRFKRSAGGAEGALQLLLQWAALPGRAEARDLPRCERIVASLQRRR